MSRSRSALRPGLGLAATILGLAVLVRGVRADGPAPLALERLVPARSLAFASVEDIGSWGRRWKETAIAKMFADPEMTGFVEPLKTDVEKMLKGDGSGESPLPPVVMKALEQLSGLSGQVGVALVDMPEKGPPVVAGGLDFGTHLSDFVTFLQRMKEQMGDDMPLVPTEKEGRTWWTMGSPDKPAMWATTTGTSFLLSTDKTWIDGVVASKAAPVADALGGLDAFQRTRASAGGDGLAVFVFANLPRILERVGEKMGPDARRIADALGLDTVKAAGYGMSFRGDGFLDSIVVEAPGADHGLLPMLKMRPMTGKGLAFAPASAFWYEESTVPLSNLLGKVRELVARIDPDVERQLEKALADAKEATGVDLETELLAGLADDVAVYLAIPETGGLYPELAMSFAVKDPKTFEATAERAVSGLLSRVGRDERVTGSQRTIEWHGKRLHVIDLAAVKGKRVVPFTPTWTMLDDRWVVTLVPHAMKELILRSEGASPGLGSQEDVQALLKAAPEGSGAFAYVDLQAILNLAYDTGVPVLQTVAKPNVLGVPLRLDWAQLPAARSMRPYFRSLGAFTRCDGQSLRVSVHSPVGLVLPLVAVGVGVAAVTGARRHGHADFEGPTTALPDRESQVMIAELQVQNLVEVVKTYHLEKGTLPVSLEQLTQETNPTTGKAWLERVSRDPWGNAYEFRVSDAKKGEFSVRSAGPDQVPDTLDDIVQPPPSGR